MNTDGDVSAAGMPVFAADAERSGDSAERDSVVPSPGLDQAEANQAAPGSDGPMEFPASGSPPQKRARLRSKRLGEADAALVEVCAVELTRLVQSTVEARISAGQMLLETFYENRIEAYNDKRTGKVGLEDLLRVHGQYLSDNGWRPHLLRRCIKVAHCVRKVLEISDAKQISSNATFSHLVVLAESPAKEEATRAAYEALAKERMSIDQLSDRLGVEPRKPRTPSKTETWKSRSEALLQTLKAVNVAELKNNDEAATLMEQIRDAAENILNQIKKPV
jgi:hypothetical protein